MSTITRTLGRPAAEEGASGERTKPASRYIMDGSQRALTVRNVKRDGEWLKTCAILASALVLAACSTSGGSGFPREPRFEEVSSPVLLSHDGRVITVRGVIVCGHRPVLIAHSYPHRITLKWFNPDTNCDAEAIKGVMVSVSLPDPLGHRQLVQASNGRPIRHHKVAR